MKTAILIFLASLTALAQTATFNAVKLTGPVTATNNAITAQYATQRIGSDVPATGTQAGVIGVTTSTPFNTTSTFSGWGQSVANVTNSWNTVEFFLHSFNASAVPSTVAVRVRQLPANTALWTNNPSTWTVLASTNITITSFVGVFTPAIARFQTTFSHTNNLWIEYETNGRDGGRLADNVLTTLIPDPPGRWYTTSTNLAGAWAKASNSLAFWARFSLSTDNNLDVSSAAIRSAVPVATRANAVINLPDTIYALEGREMNLYFQNFIWGYDGLQDLKPAVFPTSLGRVFASFGGFYRYTHGATSATNAITLYAMDEFLNPVVSRRINLVGRPQAYPSTPVSRNVHCIGDSTMGGSGAAVLAELVNLFSADSNYTLTLVGSNTGTNASTVDAGGTVRLVACDAIPGWSATMFVSNSTTAWTTIGGSARTGSPFVFSGSFNYSSFLTAQSITMASGDVVVINLGINDIAAAQSVEGADVLSSRAITAIETMIQSISSAVPGVRVLVCMTIPPNDKADAWGVDYAINGITQYDVYVASRRLMAQRIVEAFNGRTASNIHCIAYGATLDTVNNYSTTSTVVNSRNSTTYLRASSNSGLHPANSGYYQLADTLRAALKGIE